MSEREMLRHTLATLAYRGGKVVRGSTDHFAEFKTEATIRTPGQILAHVGDLLDWALALAERTARLARLDPAALAGGGVAVLPGPGAPRRAPRLRRRRSGGASASSSRARSPTR